MFQVGDTNRFFLSDEQWNAKTSTLLQVLVSIQSLIMVPNPYFNEPGYQSSMGSAHGKAQDKAYSDNIRYQTAQWAMVNQMKSPSPGFEEVIRAHFAIKGDIILKQLEQWASESTQFKAMWPAMIESYKTELESIRRDYKQVRN
jgi:baculoviral IAP repeat-containing protein 6 (apollon)